MMLAARQHYLLPQSPRGTDLRLVCLVTHLIKFVARNMRCFYCESWISIYRHPARTALWLAETVQEYRRPGTGLNVLLITHCVHGIGILEIAITRPITPV